jgi:hypothetical protein
MHAVERFETLGNWVSSRIPTAPQIQAASKPIFLGSDAALKVKKILIFNKI